MSRNVEPSSTPAGIAICSVSSSWSIPVPSHVRQGLRMTRPSPRQIGQALEIIRKPCECMTWPRPPQR